VKALAPGTLSLGDTLVELPLLPIRSGTSDQRYKIVLKFNRDAQAAAVTVRSRGLEACLWERLVFLRRAGVFFTCRTDLVCPWISGLGQFMSATGIFIQWIREDRSWAKLT
jgi:hypothetical protein